MPNNTQYDRNHIVSAAMNHFWDFGFSATSMNSLTKKPGISRKGIYSLFSSKNELFIACLEKYKDDVVTPAFAQVEKKGASLIDVKKYFETQIELADQSGFPGLGCLLGNTMTEIASHDDDIYQRTKAHHIRLKDGFLNALRGEIGTSSDVITRTEQVALAELIACTTQGIWAYSRLANNADELRSKVAMLLKLVEIRIKK